MSKHALEIETDFRDLGPAAWIKAMTDLGDEHGYFLHLGDQHMVTFLDAGPKLLVTFEDAEKVRLEQKSGAPVGFQLVQEDGWSHLSIMSAGPSWFREDEIYRHFDRLTDDGFFDDFDQILFTGDDAAGYAAAAYSVAAPGARLLLTRPQSTQDPRKVGFDRRFLAQRRVDFTSRYGYAPDMIEAAEKAYIAYDPMHRIDAMHAGLFHRGNVKMLRCFGFSQNVAGMIRSMGHEVAMLRNAMEGALNEPLFYEWMRGRRTQSSYNRNIVKLAQKSGHPRLAATLCANRLRDEGFDPYYAKQLQELERAGFAPLGEVAKAAAE